MMVIGIAVVWALGGAWAIALARAAARGDAAIAKRLVGERRQVGVCGSCGDPVMFSPEALAATCPCGACVLPRRFIAYGDRAHG